jgi:SPOR domain
MTDDNTARYRSNDPFSSRAVGPDGHGSDPLAELARLIGQNDPFATHGRDSGAPELRFDNPAVQRPELPHLDERASYADGAAYREQAYDDSASHGSRHEPYIPHEPAPEEVPQPEWARPAEPAFDPFPLDSQRPPSAPLDGYDPPIEAPPPAFLAEFKYPGSQQQPQDALAAFADSHHTADFQQPQSPRIADVGSLPPSFTSGMPLPPPQGDEYYDDAPQGGRRKGLLTVAAVLCLAVVGTAGAFGFRAWMGGTSVKSPPPVIKASAEPSKVAPPPASDPAANKITYDRFADRGQNEKVVAREEKPVDIKTVTRGAAPAANVPGATSPVFPAPPAAAAQAGNPPSVLTEPKRVRTVPIRPEAADTSARARTPELSQAIPSSPVQAAPARQAAVAPANAPMNLANPVAAAPPPPPPQVRAPAVRPAPATTSSANAPLSLSPNANLPPPSAAVAPSRPPARVASAPSGNGSYLVQVSSQRSEADAQASFRSLQSRYSGVLGDRQPVIRRADLAGKGTYYRAMVGPFSTRDQAVQLCSSLKAAGGDCVVQAN